MLLTEYIRSSSVEIVRLLREVERLKECEKKNHFVDDLVVACESLTELCDRKTIDRVKEFSPALAVSLLVIKMAVEHNKLTAPPSIPLYTLRVIVGAKETSLMSARTLLITVAALLALIPPGCWAFPHYRVYSQEMSGLAKLKEAESSRKIAIEEAKAMRESAVMLAEAEVERAKGVADANKIIGDSLKGNDAYLRYLWVQGLNDGHSEVVYVPTEANLPILEASRRAPESTPVAPVPTDE
jgi:hypothetical protein